jgi:hypothetical protein
MQNNRIECPQAVGWLFDPIALYGNGNGNVKFISKLNYHLSIKYKRNEKIYKAKSHNFNTF